MFVHVHNRSKRVNRPDLNVFFLFSSTTSMHVCAQTKIFASHYHQCSERDKCAHDTRAVRMCATCSIFDVSHTFCVYFVFMGYIQRLDFILVILVHSVANTESSLNSFQVHYCLCENKFLFFFKRICGVDNSCVAY